MSNEKNLPYAVVCGGVNIDIGAHSFLSLIHILEGFMTNVLNL